jgi:hypothetical protein
VGRRRPQGPALDKARTLITLAPALPRPPEAIRTDPLQELAGQRPLDQDARRIGQQFRNTL